MLISENDIERAIQIYKGCCQAGNPNKKNLRIDRSGNRIEFKMTFTEWIGVWLESGHWFERGCLVNQYVMSRFNDVGHYEIGNVFIQTQAENARDSSKGIKKPARSATHCQHISESNKGKIAHNKGKPISAGALVALNTPSAIAKRIATKSKPEYQFACPYCSVKSHKGVMNRFHFEKCKMKI